MQTNPLEGLHDVIAPNHVDWWPLAPTWWVIIALLFIAVLSAVYAIYKAYQYKKAKRYAVLLSQNEQSPQQLHIILKRLVIEYYGKHLAAQPTKQWCETLNTLSGLTFTEQEILSLYSRDNSDLALSKKFSQAIKCFKVKEPLHV